MVLSSKDRKVMDGFLEDARDRDSPVMFLLHKIQSQWNVISEDKARYVSERLGIPMTQIYFASSFYEDFTLSERGKVIIRVCRGVVCHSKGSLKVLEQVSAHLGIGDGETTGDGMITLIGSSCIGQCDGAPAMMVNEVVHRNLSKERIVKVLDEIREGN